MYKFLVSIAFIFLAAVTHAASDDFTVQLQFGSDTTPPTTPAWLTATPIAATQINIAWATSTDNISVGGYQVFRDAAQIATTTATTYVDTALSASTTYDYSIIAFDTSFNYATATAIVSTTTPAIPATTTPASSSGGEKIELVPVPLEIEYLEVIPSIHSATLRYRTKGYVRPTVRWGETLSYESGSALGKAYSMSHETLLSNLKPNTSYYFIIEGENRLGTFGVLTEGVFTTRGLDIDLPPMNVSGLTATKAGDDVLLQWNNPYDTDFEKVRVVRGADFYPSDPVDGWLVYEGGGSDALDVSAAMAGRRTYYTIFTYDEAGNISSGAVVVYVPQSVTQDFDTPVSSTTDDVTEDVPPVYEEINISFDDIHFIQNSTELTNESGNVRLDGSAVTEVYIPYDVLPEHLKTILVRITDSTDSDTHFTFLLRVNKDRTRYTALIAPLGVAGVFPVTVSIYDYKTNKIAQVQGDIISTITFYQDEEARGFWDSLTRWFGFLFWNFLPWFLLLLIILLFIARGLIRRG